VARTLADVQPGDRPIVLTGPPGAGSSVLVSELGGVSFDSARPEDWHGYASVTSAEDLVARYRDLVGALLDSPAVAGFCWTQLTDTRQETNGLLRADRTPKAEVALLHAATRRPAVSIAGEALAVALPQPVDRTRPFGPS
jgi:predicted ATPase